jgi:hypothetical protein
MKCKRSQTCQLQLNEVLHEIAKHCVTMSAKILKQRKKINPSQNIRLFLPPQIHYYIVDDCQIVIFNFS